MARLHDKFRQEIMPVLAEKLGRTNPMSLPRLQKIVVNMGVGKAVQEKARMEQAADQLGQIAGQRPQITKSKRAVSGFRLRENIWMWSDYAEKIRIFLDFIVYFVKKKS